MAAVLQHNENLKNIEAQVGRPLSSSFGPDIDVDSGPVR
jgi:hypothetical protein